MLKLTFPYSIDRKCCSNPDSSAAILSHSLCYPFCSYSAAKVFSSSFATPSKKPSYRNAQQMLTDNDKEQGQSPGA